MKTNLFVRAMAFVLAGTLTSMFCARGQDTTTITYQGRLNQQDASANGTFDFRFVLYDLPEGGDLPRSEYVTNSAVLVSNGLFTASMDFGAHVFTTILPLYLEIGLRAHGSEEAFTILEPRQPLTAAPYANFAQNAKFAAAAGTASSTELNAVSNAGLQPNSVTGDKLLDGTVSPADLNLPAFHTTMWKTDGNAGTTAGPHFLGTTDNQPIEFKVGGQRALRLEPFLGSPNLVGGSDENVVSSGAFGVTIAGGGGAGQPNRVDGSYGSIGGGLANTVQMSTFASSIGGGRGNAVGPNSEGSTIGGGFSNRVTGYYSSVGGGIWNTIDHHFATVSGGQGNLASEIIATVAGGQGNEATGQGAVVSGGWSNRATLNWTVVAGGHENQAVAYAAHVSGGEFNRATNTFDAVGGGRHNLAGGSHSTVAGGGSNWATNHYAAVPGGQLNVAGGQFSLAAGRRAKSIYDGDFVWADSTDADFTSTSSNQFLIRAAGGVGIGTNNPQSALHVAGTVTASSFSGSGGLLSLGTLEDQPLEFKVNDQRAFRLEATGSNSVNVIGGWSGNTAAPGTVGVTIGGGGAGDWYGSGDAHLVESHFGVVSGGSGNLIRANSEGASVGGGVRNTIENNANHATIGGGYRNRAGNFSATIAGGERNIASGFTSTVGGGQYNTASQSSSTVGGGDRNTASGLRATVSGGYTNIASGTLATVGGGNENVAGGQGSTVGGGHDNTASGFYATIAGGSRNLASGYGATVPGGDWNEASGDYTLAAGYRAKAKHAGTFVWADGALTDFSSTANNQFLIRASGGVGIGTASPSQPLHVAGNTMLSRNDGRLILHTPGRNDPGRYGILFSNNYLATFLGDDTQEQTFAFYSTFSSRRTNDARLRVHGKANPSWGHYAELTHDGANAQLNTDSEGLELRAMGQRGLRLQGVSTPPGNWRNVVNLIGGHAVNDVDSNLAGVTIGGGGGMVVNLGVTNKYPNWVGSSFGTIAGGFRNEITDSAWGATIGGGFANQALAGGDYAVIPGGQSNVVSGAYAIAAGFAARAEHNGSFVWADSTGRPLTSTVNNQMLLRASGGVRIYSDAGQASGVRLNPGANSWSIVSDRNVKENVREIDKREVLEKVASMPVTEWNLITQEPSIRHIGPMAQDFQAAFGLGESDRQIDTSDAQGVALAAIQGLNEKLEAALQRRDEENEALRKRVNELEQRVLKLTTRENEP